MIRSFVSFCLRFFKSRIQLQLEIVYLRKQLEILTRTSAKPRLTPSDRFFFSILTDIFSSWKETLLIIKPETVIRWHQQGFRLYWRWKSRATLGRPKITQVQIVLIKEMANDNPLWGASRIYGEMLRLGVDISESTVLRYMPRKPQTTTRQRWKTFLKNHSFGEEFTHIVSALDIRQILTAYRVPWQNGYVERLIGSIRRECLDHLIIINETHLRGILYGHICNYNAQRTHLGINKDSPKTREVQAEGDIVKIAVANGLHHFYFRKAA